MGNRDETKLKPGNIVVLVQIPPGLLNDLPSEDQQAIRDAVGKSIKLNDYDEAGRAEIEFHDRDGILHYIYVQPEYIRKS